MYSSGSSHLTVPAKDKQRETVMRNENHTRALAKKQSVYGAFFTFLFLPYDINYISLFAQQYLHHHRCRLLLYNCCET